MKTQIAIVSIGFGGLLAACGGPPPTTTGGATAHPAHAAGGQAIVTQGTGQAVSVSANQRFNQAAAAMHQHDDANNGAGDWTAAICNEVAGRFEAAANEQPGGAFAEAWFDRGLVFDRCGMAEPARQSLQRALSVSRNGNYCRARVELGVYQFRAHQVADAEASFTQAIHDDPNCVEGYTNLAMLQRERGQGQDRVQAVANIRQALARDDKYIPALNQLALTYLAEAGDDPHSQRLMLAGIVCNQAAQVTQQHGTDMTADVRSFLADVYNTWGLIDIKSGQIIHALEHFTRAHQLNDHMFEAWMNYGTINLSFRGYTDARDAFQHAVALRPNDYDAHIGLGVALRGLATDQAGFAQAQAEYNRAQQIDATRPDSYYNLGVLAGNYGAGTVDSLTQAIGFLDQFIQRAGGNPRYADALARGQHYKHNFEQAAAALRALGTSTPAPAGGTPPAAGGATPPAAGAPAPAAGAPSSGAAPAPGAAAPAAGAPPPAAAH